MEVERKIKIAKPLFHSRRLWNNFNFWTEDGRFWINLSLRFHFAIIICRLWHNESHGVRISLINPRFQ